MGRHEKIIEQYEIIKELLSATPMFADSFCSTTDVCVRRVAEYVYNREVALKKIINVMAFGEYISTTYEVVDEMTVLKIAFIKDKELAKSNPQLEFDRDTGGLIVKVKRYI